MSSCVIDCHLRKLVELPFDELSEIALQFGADDIDGTVQKESIMHLAGSTTPLDHDRVRLARLITDSGCIPVQRNTTYERFEIYIPPMPKRRQKLKMAYM